MNMLLIEERECVAENKAIIGGRRYEHMRDVLKVSEGDVLSAGLINGLIGQATVVGVTDADIEVQCSFVQDPPAKMPLKIILALPRPPVLRRLLSALASFGVEKIVLLQTARVEKSYWNSPVVSAQGIREALVLGLEQARDTVLPEVILKQRFRPFVEDELPEMIKGSHAFVAHPDAESISCPSDVRDPCVLAVGPEGGFVPFEMELLRDIGFQPIHLGKRVLRVETAVSALIGRVMSI